MVDMDCESLLLDDVPGKYSEDSDCGDICNADEDALLADVEETDFVSSKCRTRSRNKFNEEAALGVAEEQESEDVLDLGAHDVELDEEEGHKKSSGLMTVSSTTPADSELNLSQEEGEERETRFKSERQITTCTKKYTNIPDSLDDVVISNYSYNNNRNQRPFRGRGRGYHNNNIQRNKPEGKTVLINPHFKGKPNTTNNSRANWDARERINRNYKNQVGHIQPFIQPHNQPPEIWSNVQNMQMQQQQQPPPPQFQQFLPPQVPQQQMYHQPAVPVQHPPQVPQQLIPTYQQNQQCFIQPLQEQFYSQPPQFNHPQQFNHPVPQFHPVSQFPSDPLQFSQPNSIHMVQYPSPQFIVSQNQMMQPPHDPYSQPMYSQPIQHNNPTIQVPLNQQPKYAEHNESNTVYPPNQNKRKVPNNIVLRKNKKRNQVVSKNLHEVRTVQIPDTTVQEDDEDEETKQYRKLIEEQKKKREQILQQKEARRRQAVEVEQAAVPVPVLKQTQQVLVPIPQQKIPMVVSKPVLNSNQTVSKAFLRQKAIQRLAPLKPIQNSLSNVVRKVVKQPNPNIKVINVSNESSVDKQHLSSFLSNRKILAKDQSLLDTNIVLISNLADGTTAVKLRKMCVGIGDVQNLQMSPKERQATIQFNSVASAHAFFKKYQRTMLDLSMIQVTLKPIT